MARSRAATMTILICVAALLVVMATAGVDGRPHRRSSIVFPGPTALGWSRRGRLGVATEPHRPLSSRDLDSHELPFSACEVVPVSLTPPPTTSSPAIIFPGQEGANLWRMPTDAGHVPAATDAGLVPECGGVMFMAFHNGTQSCEQLAVRGTCGADSWFVLDRATGKAGCRQPPCPAGEALYAGECRDLSATDVCSPAMLLVMDEYGEADCDCAAGAVFWPAQQRCYPAMRRGPCAAYHMLGLDSTGAVDCVYNTCGHDGWLLWPATDTCHQLYDERDSPCQFSRMEVDPTSLQPTCVSLHTNSVFAVHALRCSPGNRRFTSGRCKREVHGAGGNSDDFKFKARRCPTGFKWDGNSACRKLSMSTGLG